MATERITISGEIPEGRTTGAVTYYLLDRARNAIVGSLVLPDVSEQFRRFSIPIEVPSLSQSFDVGVFDNGGRFASAGFTIETPEPTRGAVGAR